MAGAPTDDARVCLAAPPLASATLSGCRVEPATAAGVRRAALGIHPRTTQLGSCGAPACWTTGLGYRQAATKTSAARLGNLGRGGSSLQAVWLWIAFTKALEEQGKCQQDRPTRGKHRSHEPRGPTLSTHEPGRRLAWSP